MVQKIPTSGLDGNATFRNLIINGDMQIAQRATSVSSHSADSYVNIDRWKTRVNSQGVYTVSQSTTVPTGEGFVNSQKWDCTTADGSPAAGDFVIFEQKFEGKNLQHLQYGTSGAKKLTVSFHVRSNKTGAYTVGLYSADGSRHIESSYTISSADTWEKKIVTFAGDTGGTLNNDNGEAMKLWFWLGAGTNFSSGTHATSWAAYSQANVLVDNQVNIADSTDNEWYITGVQLEVGDNASDFEHLPHDVQLQRCFRYCFQVNPAQYDPTSIGACNSSDTCISHYFFPEEMRGDPGLTTSGTASDYVIYEAGDVHACSAIPQANTINNFGMRLIFTSSGNLAQGNVGENLPYNADAILRFDAEL
jgi:hypothetical protein